MIFYIVCIMSFVWQTGTVSQPREYLSTDLDILIPRIIISGVLALGFVYLVLIGATFSRYSDPMEQAWQERIRGWLAEKTLIAAGYYDAPADQRATVHQRYPYDAKGAKPNGLASHTYPENLKTEQAMVPDVTLVKSVEPEASFAPREVGDVKPRSTPKTTANAPTALPPGFRPQKMNAFDEKVEKGGDNTPGVNPFISFAQAPGAILGSVGLPSMISPSAPLPSNSIKCQDNETAPQLPHTRADFVEPPICVVVADSERHEESPSANKDEHFGARVVKVVAVPLKAATTADGKSPVLEEMQELHRFDVRAGDGQDSEGGVLSDGDVEPTASTSQVPHPIPVPRELLERGLASPSWGRFCEVRTFQSHHFPIRLKKRPTDLQRRKSFRHGRM